MSCQGRVELFGGALVIAVLGSIGTAYGNRVAETVPYGVPPDAAEAARHSGRRRGGRPHTSLTLSAPAARHSPRGLHPSPATDRHRKRRVRSGHGYPGCAPAPKRTIGLRTRWRTEHRAGCSDCRQRGQQGGSGGPPSRCRRTACLDRLSYDVLSERHPRRRGRSGRRSSTSSRGRVGPSGMAHARRSRSSCRHIGWSLGRGCGSTSLCFINRTGHLLRDVEYLHHVAW